MTLMIVLISLGGFALLCISNDRHQRDVFGRKLSRRQTRSTLAAGWCCLIIAYLLATKLYGFAYGTLLSAGIATVTAGVVVATLNRLSRRR